MSLGVHCTHAPNRVEILCSMFGWYLIALMVIFVPLLLLHCLVSLINTVLLMKLCTLAQFTAVHLFLCIFSPPADYTREIQASAAHTEVRCVVLSWWRMLLFSLTPPLLTQRRRKNCLFTLPGLNWKRWVHSATRLPSLCCVTTSSRSATPQALDQLQSLCAGKKILTSWVDFREDRWWWEAVQTSSGDCKKYDLFNV